MNWYKFNSKKEEKENVLYVGLVGYSSQEFDETKAKQLIKEAFDEIEDKADGAAISLVSGLTDLGIPALGYQEGARRGWRLIGVAPKVANEFAWCDCDEIVIEGENWGDESEKFLSMIDILIRVGGGKQSEAEAQQVKDNGKECLEFDL
ncbi:MAG: hypothetical protein WDA06_01395 [Phenylobacterium sp.]